METGSVRTSGLSSKGTDDKTFLRELSVLEKENSSRWMVTFGDETLLCGGLETKASTINVDELAWETSLPRAGLFSMQFVQMKIACPALISSFIILDVPAQ